MASSAAFPYFAKATIKYKSPHKQDLTFAKGETIRVTGAAPKAAEGDDANDSDDDDDWLIGESLDGVRQGSFPGSFVKATDAPATTSSGDTGAIPAEAPAQLQSSVLEEEPAAHEASVVPSPARDVAKQGGTEETGFGAPLPPRPASPDAGLTQGGAESTLAGEKSVVKSESDDSAPPATSFSKNSPSKSPPPISSKPANMSSSFRDRLAAFNKPADAAPPPLPKAKPGGWKRPTLSAGAPPLSPTASTPATLTSPKVPEAAQPATSISADAGDTEFSGGGAFSAADAQSSIKMSLKDRMAALQRNESSAANATPDARPKTIVPGKIGADKRSAAMQGMGLAPPSAPARKMSSDSSNSIQDPTPSDLHSTDAVQEEGSLPVLDDAESVLSKGSAAEQESNAADETVTVEHEEEQTEEEKEAERRAAIAKRMAALGARRMGGGPAGFGARAPFSTSNKEGTTSEPGITTTVTSPTSESGQDAGPAPLSSIDPAADVTSATAEDEPRILSVPRRTAGPRKKRSAGPSPAVIVPPEEGQIPTEADGKGAEATNEGLAAASSAAEAMDTSGSVGEPLTTEHPAVTGKSLGSDSTEEFATSKPTDRGAAAATAAAEPMSTSQTEDSNSVPVEAADTTSEFAAASAAADDMDTSKTSDVAATEEGATGESDAEIAEHQRQLEEYLRGEGFFEGSSAGVDETQTPADNTTSGQAVPLSTDREVEVASPKPPSRTNSTRPPVPRTSLPPPPIATQTKDDDATQKPPSHRAGSIPPARMLPAAPEGDNISTASVEEVAAETEAADEAGPVLAAPKARLAQPTEDPEDEEILAAADAAQEGETQDEPTAAPVAEPEELTEEEQESQRRANLARRMAALGGQRIGAFPGMPPALVMGAPMPARSQSKPVLDEEATDDANVSEPEGETDYEKEEADVGNDIERSESREAPPLPTSPPPKPMSPPPPARPVPPVLPPGRPSSTAPMGNLDEAVRSATPAASPGRTSSRPPVPLAVPRSKDVSMADEESANNVGIASPPLPPTSPPPRPSSRAPPLPGTHRRQGSANSAELPSIPARIDTPASEHAQRPEASHAGIRSSVSTTSVPGSEVRHSSRDLDLTPSSRWWRQGLNPLRLPPAIAGRADAILYVDTTPKTGVDANAHFADIHLLFEDYSTTIISVSFVDDDNDETHTSLTQRHNFPPSKPSVETLRQWSMHIGSVVAKTAADASKQTNSPIGNGSPRAFVQAMVGNMPDALPPVGQSLGATILTQVGPTMMQAQADEVRPGDIVSCSQADFRGKKGLAPYHMTIGTQAEPTSGIVIECESKKNKLKCIVQSPNNKKGLPDEVSLRLDDLKSGIVKVYRIPPRQGWVQDW